MSFCSVRLCLLLEADHLPGLISFPAFVVFTPLSGGRCRRASSCLIRPINSLVSFSLHPDLTYSSLEANTDYICSQELPLFASTRTFIIDQTTSSAYYSTSRSASYPTSHSIARAKTLIAYTKVYFETIYQNNTAKK